MISIFKFIFGSRNDRLLKQYRKQVKKINALEPKMEALSDDALKAKTEEFKQRYQSGESLDSLLVEAFAVCREGSKRSLKMRHFDVQLIGGMVLHDGKIAEMRTGEGKTLVGTLAVYLNALSGDGVHVVTVNDYLAQRDAEWMGQLYNFLGLSVGINLSRLPHEEKQKAYAADITYGTNNEYGFDYLRDNMVQEANQRVQRPLNFAIVDEVDSILIDEARTPLIISGQAEDRTDLYLKMNSVPDYLEEQIGEEKADGTGVEVPGDFVVDQKSHQVYLTESGHEKAENILVQMGLLNEGESLYAPQNINLMHHLLVGLKAKKLYHRDQHYVVQDGEVVIVDEFTGRLMPGRRWADGIHQAVEAKEGVQIQQESQTMATITFQNYFRMYKKLAGMTGTADTEAYEFLDIYGLETVIIPTNKPPQRKDAQDQIYKTNPEKFQAIVDDIKGRHEKGQPVLVGTTSIENSELLSNFLRKEGLTHSVLNAKQHEKEAEIVAQAGKPGMITIATNMAGRGTDIVLGGNVEKQVGFILQDDGLSESQKEAKIQELQDSWDGLHQQVMEAGGLHIIGTERHESRRIDNQLRGRAGRQGDPGSSRFYLSLDDPLMKIFAGDMVRNMMERLKIPEGEAIEAKMVTRAIESAQRKVEGRNYEVRKNLLEFDNVSNEQRKFLYQWRNEILEAEDVNVLVKNMRDEFFTQLFYDYVPHDSIEEQWDLPGLEKVLQDEWQIDVPLQKLAQNSKHIDQDMLLQAVLDKANGVYDNKVSVVGPQIFSNFERAVMLQSIDTHWREHLASLDHLRQGVYLRSYAQKDPKQEYKKEGFQLFAQMLDHIRDEVVRIVMTVRIESEEEMERATEAIEGDHVQKMEFKHATFDDLEEVASGNPDLSDEVEQAANRPIRNTDMRIGRNDPCPCGSGKKYKQCHGKLA